MKVTWKDRLYCESCGGRKIAIKGDDCKCLDCGFLFNLYSVVDEEEVNG